MIKYSLTILFLAVAFLLKAQKPLTLEACRELALRHNEDLKIAGLQIEKAEAERAAMKTQYLPSLSGTATGIYLHKNIEMEMYLPTVVPNPQTGEFVPNVMTNPATGQIVTGADGNPIFNMYAWLPLEISLKGAYLAGISLEQPIYTGGKINAANAMTRIGIDMSHENRALHRANVLWETDQAYWLYATVQENVKLAEAYTKLLSELKQTVQHAFETGFTTHNELLKVKVKHNEALLQLQKARSGLELTRMALCRVTGLPFDTPIITTDSLLFENSGIDGFSGEDFDIASRPEYRLMQKNVDMAYEQLKLARADFLPTAGINVGYNFVGGIEFGTVDYNSSNASIIASVKIPLFHWGEGRQKQLSARQDIEIRKTELGKNARLMTLEMEQARLNLADAHTRLELVRANLEQAEENLRVNTDNFELGMGVLTDLLEAQTLWQNACSNLIEAKAELKMKETAFLKATGKLR